ncbi:MAG: hypothetical protein QF535_19560, partial [Anaerolineales bacterium]|nr:hypothetical protein [Anaerolineales bacterium]
MVKDILSVNTLTPPQRKKGQLTLFLVVALILILLTGSILYITSTISTKSVATKRSDLNKQVLNTIEIKSFVISCLDRAAEDAFYLIGQQGGTLTRADFTPEYETQAAFDKIIFDQSGNPIPDRLQFQPGIN